VISISICIIVNIFLGKKIAKRLKIATKLNRGLLHIAIFILQIVILPIILGIIDYLLVNGLAAVF